MDTLLKEILEIPGQARECYKKNKKIKLPRGVPYLGMGASYHALLTLYYTGVDIKPFEASDYYNYFSLNKLPMAVFISQSGESSDVILCLKKFNRVITITNNPKSSLAKLPKITKIVLLYAGDEKSAATKTYINTLITLYSGFEIDPYPAIARMEKDFVTWQNSAKKEAKNLYKYIKNRKISGYYVLGSGPNTATAKEAALALSETTKLGWQGMSFAQYDHGPKETANNSVVIFLVARGKEQKRADRLHDLLKKNSNALVLRIVEDALIENLSPIALISQIYLIMNYLTDYLNITYTYGIGKKVTRIIYS